MKQYVYPKEVVGFVKSNYKSMSDRVMQLKLMELFPALHFSPKTIATIRKENNLPKSLKKTLAFLKVHETRSPKIGAILYKDYHGNKQWVIKIAPNKWRHYACHVWRQVYGNKPYGFTVDWIDEKGPLVITNIQLVKTHPDPMAVGGITTWRHEGRLREMIKTAPGVYEVLLPYLWRKYHGEIPAGKWVAKIDPNKPSAIDNLRLVCGETIANGSRNLDDWYVVARLSLENNKGFGAVLKSGIVDQEIVDALIATKRENIILKREAKIKSNERDTEGSSVDNAMEGPHTEHA